MLGKPDFVALGPLGFAKRFKQCRSCPAKVMLEPTPAMIATEGFPCFEQLHRQQGGRTLDGQCDQPAGKAAADYGYISLEMPVISHATPTGAIIRSLRGVP